MTGKHWVLIKAKYCKYTIELKRNVTVLTGDSGIGKTSVCKAITKYNSMAGRCDVSVTSDCNVIVFSDVFSAFVSRDRDTSNSIFIMDENIGFLQTKEFAEIVQCSENYFLLITRNRLPNIPYSVKSIVTLKTVKNHELFETYTEDLFPAVCKKNNPLTIITEDSKIR